MIPFRIIRETQNNTFIIPEEFKHKSYVIDDKTQLVNKQIEHIYVSDVSEEKEIFNANVFSIKFKTGTSVISL